MKTNRMDHVAKRGSVRLPRTTILAAVIALSIACSLPAGAQPSGTAEDRERAVEHGPGRGGPGAPNHGEKWPGGPPRPEAGSLIERHAERLGLDAKTSEAIRKIIKQSRERGERIENDIRRERQKLGEMLRADKPNEAAIMKQVDRVGELEVDERKNRLRAMLEIRSKLSPEQREKLIELRREAYGDWHERGFDFDAPACRGDVERYCKDQPPGWPLRRCMIENRDRLSPKCRNSMQPPRDAEKKSSADD